MIAKLGIYQRYVYGGIDRLSLVIVYNYQNIMKISHQYKWLNL